MKNCATTTGFLIAATLPTGAFASTQITAVELTASSMSRIAQSGVEVVRSQQSSPVSANMFPASTSAFSEIGDEFATHGSGVTSEFSQNDQSTYLWSFSYSYFRDPRTNIVDFSRIYYTSSTVSALMNGTSDDGFIVTIETLPVGSFFAELCGTTDCSTTILDKAKTRFTMAERNGFSLKLRPHPSVGGDRFVDNAVFASLGIAAAQATYQTGKLDFKISFSPIPAPVPEPQAWALMLAGFGFVGAIVRKRTKSRVEALTIRQRANRLWKTKIGAPSL